MTFITHRQLWAYRNLLPVVHAGNQIMETECGARSATTVVSWDLDESGPILHVVVVDSASPQKPLVLSDVTDLGSLEESVQKWFAGTDPD